MHKFDTKRGEPVRMLLERYGAHTVTAHVQRVDDGACAMVAVELRNRVQQRLGGVDCRDLPMGYVEALLRRHFAAVLRNDDTSDPTRAMYIVANFRVPPQTAEHVTEVS